MAKVVTIGHHAILSFPRRFLRNGEQVELALPMPDLVLPEGSSVKLVQFVVDPYVEKGLFVRGSLRGYDRTFGQFVSAPMMAKMPLGTYLDPTCQEKLTFRAECPDNQTVETLCGFIVVVVVPGS